jgi:threonine synthase
VLDVETTFSPPHQSSSATGDDYKVFLDFDAETDVAPSAGAAWRQLFDERAAMPPIWSVSTDASSLDSSGVWRYRELILPVAEQYVVTRPEGNTTL